MHFSLKKVVAPWFIAVAVSLAACGAAHAAEVAGNYTCEGKNPGGGTYTGTVAIVKRGEVYRVTWKLGSKETYTGIGILQGDVLAVSYYGSMSGVVAYKVEDNKLVGKWSMANGDGSVSTETLSK